MKSRTKPASNEAAKKQKKPSFLRKFIFTAIKSLIVFLLILGCSLAGLAGGAIYGFIKTAKPITAEQLGQTSFNKTTFIYDSKGKVIQKLTGKDNMDSEWLLEKDAPLFLKNAIIAIEDERFYTHPGIDLQGIVNAGIGFVKSIFTGSDTATPVLSKWIICSRIVRDACQQCALRQRKLLCGFAEIFFGS